MAKNSSIITKKGAKSFTKAVKLVKSKSGSYSFRSEIVPKDKVQEFSLRNKMF